MPRARKTLVARATFADWARTIRWRDVGQAFLHPIRRVSSGRHMAERVIQTSRRLATERQIHAAIAHFRAGDFERAITLSGAAEGQTPEPSEPSRHLFKGFEASCWRKPRP
jgi:tRNA threonylcarbamoyladenosine modification (KEOPS) complex Cgi121 subunit